MSKPHRKRPVVRSLALGCGALALLFTACVVWVGIDVVKVTRPFELTDHHPFRSHAGKERYLAWYDARAEKWPVASETRTVETSWGSTFVRISGPADGPPMVLLPGANATSLMWEPNIEAFARDHRVFAVDNIVDFGRSVSTRDLTTPGDFVDWLDELFDALDLEDDIRLVGLSYGGWIASQYALEHPERLRTLVLVAPAATVLGFSTDFIKKGILCIIPLKRFVRDMVTWALADAAAGNEAQRRMVEEAVDNAWLGLRSFKPKQMVHPTVLSDEQLENLAPPTLFLVGENEVIYAARAAEAIRRLNTVAPQIETELVPACGHDLTLIQADFVNRRILDFLGPVSVEAPQ